MQPLRLEVELDQHRLSVVDRANGQYIMQVTVGSPGLVGPGTVTRFEQLLHEIIASWLAPYRVENPATGRK